ncbi:MAG: YkgJ family cysteine cluster protein [Vampirovibrionales bacterium]
MASPPLSDRPFECAQCGLCCTNVSIPIEPEKALALLKKPWVQERLKPLNLSFKPLPHYKSDPRWQIPLTPQRRCLFLGDNQECLIHHFEGETLKPNECLRYPFSTYIHTLHGTSLADVTASCQTIAQELSNPFPNNQWVPSKPLPEHPHGHDIQPAAWPLTPQQNGSWQKHQSLIDQLTEEASNPHQSMEHFLQIAASPLPQLQSVCLQTFRAHRWRLLCLRKPQLLQSVWELIVQQKYKDPMLFGPTTIPLAALPLWPELTNHSTLKHFVLSLLKRQLPYTQGYDYTTLWWLALSGWVLASFYTQALILCESDPSKPLPSADEALLTLAIRIVERYYTSHQPRFTEWVHRRSRPGWEHRYLCHWLGIQVP